MRMNHAVQGVIFSCRSGSVSDTITLMNDTKPTPVSQVLARVTNCPGINERTLAARTRLQPGEVSAALEELRGEGLVFGNGKGGFAAMSQVRDDQLRLSRHVVLREARMRGPRFGFGRTVIENLARDVSMPAELLVMAADDLVREGRLQIRREFYALVAS